MIKNSLIPAPSSPESIAWHLSVSLASKFGDHSESLRYLLCVLYYNALQGSLRISLSDFIRENLIPPSINDALVKTLSLELPEIILKSPRIFGSVPDYKPVIVHQGFLYLQKFFILEQNLAHQIHSRLLPSDSVYEKSDIDEALLAAEKHLQLSHPFTFDDQQLSSLRKIFHSRLVIISGGPGTGKTSLIVNLLRTFLYLHLQCSLPMPRIQLAAPTGRAAARITDALLLAQNSKGQKTDLQHQCDSLLPQKAITLHRLLGKKPSFSFKNELKTLSCDLLILDEASMIDLQLMKNLLCALPSKARLVLIGDKDQLPPVEQGAVFHDLCPDEQNAFHPLTPHTVHLHKSYRFKGDISLLADHLRRKEFSNFSDLLKANSFSSLEEIPENHVLGFVPLPSEATLLKLFISKSVSSFFAQFLQICSPKTASSEHLLSALYTSKILCATHQGLLGDKYINSLCQSLFSPDDRLFYHGLPVMMESNHPSLGLSNGDQGILSLYDHSLKAVFPSLTGPKNFSLPELPSFELAYASTIHKSQGSEYDKVMVLVPPLKNSFLSKELLYTAITRSKKQLILIGTLDDLEGIKDLSSSRKNGLMDQLESFQTNSSSNTCKQV